MRTESRGRLPTYLLVRGSGPNVVHACNFFFYFSEYKICLPGGRRILAHVFRRPWIFGLWLMFSEDQRFWILAHVFRGLGFWISAHVFRGPRVLGFWLMFSEDQRFWILAHVFKDLGFLDLGSYFQRTKGFLGFGSCFQRTKGSGSWLMFSEA